MNAYTNLAKESIAYYLENKKFLPLPNDLSQEFYITRAGAFVSLHLPNGDLRGCIGTVEPTKKNLGEEIIYNAVSAAMRDPRFPPLKANELADLDISVDVLSEPEPIPDLTNHDPRKYGLIAICRGRSGLLLPDLEGVDTAEDQLEIVLQKGGILPTDAYKLLKFTVTRHH